MTAFPTLNSLPAFSVLDNVTALLTLRLPFTVVTALAVAMLTSPLVTAREVAPEESNVDTEVSPDTF